MHARRLLASTLAVAALGLTACGSKDDAGDAAAPGNPTDRAFVAEMVPHHQSAVDMARIAQQRGRSPFVKRLADSIVRTQDSEIGEMRAQDGELQAQGVARGSLGAPSMAMGMDTGSLRTATPFDRAFVRMMLPHHEAALPMAKAELAKGADPELRKLAQAIIAGQTREIRAMRDFQAKS